MGRWRRDGIGQVRDVDHTAIGHQYRGVQSLLQFAHVHRPVMPEQQTGRLAGEANGRGPLARDPHQQRGDELAQVLATVAQRQQMEFKPAQPGQQVVAKGAGPDSGVEILVSGREHPDIHLDGRRRADRQDLTLLQYAQQNRLRRRRQLGDLIEKERPLMSGPDQTCAILDGAGERALLGPKELALDERGGQSATVERHKAARATG